MEQTAAPPALSNGFNHIKAIMKEIVQDLLEMFTINANLNVITSYPEDIHTYMSLPLEISSTSILVCT